MKRNGGDQPTTTREYVETTLGIAWAHWEKMSLTERVEAQTGERPAYLDLPAGPERLAAFRSAALRSPRRP